MGIENFLVEPAVISLHSKIKNYYEKKDEPYSKLIKLSRKEMYALISLIQSIIEVFNRISYDVEKTWALKKALYVMSLHGRINSFLGGLDFVDQIKDELRKVE